MSRILPAVLILMPLPALAHPGDHAGSGLWHFLTEPDHLALMALVLVVAVVAVKLWSRR
jgi:hydrogenase/urease accessory protein HupE